MRIDDLTEAHEDAYLLCLEEYSPEAREGRSAKRRWYQEMRKRGLGVKLAFDEHGEVGGMIQYLPAEHTFIEGEDTYLILCVWVHGHTRGRGNFQGRGMGSALLAAAEADVGARGAKGVAAWGLMLPFWMRASWFRRHGYRRVDRDGMAALMFKPLAEGAVEPSFLRAPRPPPAGNGVVAVTAFCSGWCNGLNATCERARHVAAEFGDAVDFRWIDTRDRMTRAAWGITDGLFVDGVEVSIGPPLTEDDLRARLEKAVHPPWWRRWVG